MRWPSSATNAERISFPSSVRIGIDCKVWIARREATRRSDSLVEGRVEPAVGLRQQRRQRAQIRVEELESSRHSSITGTIAWSSRIDRSTFASVE